MAEGNERLNYNEERDRQNNYIAAIDELVEILKDSKDTMFGGKNKRTIENFGRVEELLTVIVEQRPEVLVKAKGIVDQADTILKQVSSMKEKASKKVEETNAECQQMIEKTQRQCDEAYDNARKKGEEARQSLISDGNNQKMVIIAKAEETAEQLVSQDKITAEAIQRGNEYIEKIKREADNYAESVKREADEYAVKIKTETEHEIDAQKEVYSRVLRNNAQMINNAYKAIEECLANANSEVQKRHQSYISAFNNNNNQVNGGN